MSSLTPSFYTKYVDIAQAYSQPILLTGEKLITSPLGMRISLVFSAILINNLLTKLMLNEYLKTKNSSNNYTNCLHESEKKRFWCSCILPSALTALITLTALYHLELISFSPWLPITHFGFTWVLTLIAAKTNKKTFVQVYKQL